MSEIKYFTFFSATWFSLIIIFNFIIDPLQYYNKSSNPIFITNQRYQIPGLVRNYSFDTIYIGTSHSENFRTEILDSIYNSKGINLAISGSSSNEQYEVVKLALSTGKVRHVLWEMNYKSFSGIQSNLKSKGDFPYYLYNTNTKTPFLYLFSIDTLLLSFKNIIGSGSTTLKGLNSWGEREINKFDGKNVIKHFCHRKNNSMHRDMNYELSHNIQSNLINLVEKYSDIDFILLIPPLSVYNFALPNQAQHFNDFRKIIYKQKEIYKNIKIYDFMLDYDLISKPKNYKDIEHFSPKISDDILKKISSFSNGIFSRDIYVENKKFTQYITNWSKENNHCD